VTQARHEGASPAGSVWGDILREQITGAGPTPEHSTIMEV
jgi:hypothetical protein